MNKSIIQRTGYFLLAAFMLLALAGSATAQYYTGSRFGQWYNTLNSYPAGSYYSPQAIASTPIYAYQDDAYGGYAYGRGYQPGRYSGYRYGTPGYGGEYYSNSYYGSPYGNNGYYGYNNDPYNNYPQVYDTPARPNYLSYGWQY